MIQTFKSNSKSQPTLTAGMTGSISTINADGHAQIAFDYLEKKTWVFKSSFSMLKKLPARRFEIGTRVRYSRSRHKHDGREGIIKQVNSSGSYTVTFDGGTQVKASHTCLTQCTATIPRLTYNDSSTSDISSSRSDISESNSFGELGKAGNEATPARFRGNTDAFMENQFKLATTKPGRAPTPDEDEDLVGMHKRSQIELSDTEQPQGDETSITPKDLKSVDPIAWALQQQEIKKLDPPATFHAAPEFKIGERVDALGNSQNDPNDWQAAVVKGKLDDGRYEILFDAFQERTIRKKPRDIRKRLQDESKASDPSQWSGFIKNMKSLKFLPDKSSPDYSRKLKQAKQNFAKMFPNVPIPLEVDGPVKLDDVVDTSTRPIPVDGPVSLDDVVDCSTRPRLDNDAGPVSLDDAVGSVVTVDGMPTNDSDEDEMMLAKAAESSENTTSSKWREYTADDGEKYYFNTEDQTTTWDRPAELGPDMDVSDAEYDEYV